MIIKLDKQTTLQVKAIIKKEDDGYIAFCQEVAVVSQGDTVNNARNNLKEALELFFEVASPEEVLEILKAREPN